MNTGAGTALRVLLIDDSALAARRILDRVRRAGFAPTHERVSTPRALKSALARESWDLVIADLGNSRGRTLVALAKLREAERELPCVFYRRKTDDNEALEAIVAGMPDCKVCEFPERLGAVVRAELFAAERRRKQRRAIDRLRRDQSLHRHCFETMLDGFALHELIVDARGKPCDYRFLEVNPAFERITGLARSRVIGKTLREVIPQIEPFWIETYGRVALTGEPAQFEHFSEALEKYFEVVATRTARMQFSTVFRDVSERRRSQAMLQTLVEQNIAGIYIIQDNKIAYANPRYANLCGYTLQELLALPCVEILVAEEDRALVMERIRKRIAGDVGAQQYPLRLRRKDGSTIEVEAHGARIEHQGRPAILGVMIDVTERTRAESRLRVSQQQQRALLDSTPDMVWIKDRDGRYVDVNAAWGKTYGLAPEHVRGKLDRELHADASLADTFRDEDAQVLASKAALRIERRVVADGKPMWMETIKVPILDERGEVTAVAGTARDITERKIAGQALRESEERYRAMFEAQRDAMALADAQTHQFIEVNQALVALYGYSRSELLRMKGPDLSAEPGAGESFVREVVGAAPGRAIARRHRRKDGSEILVEISAVTTTLGGRKVYCAIIRDVSERKRAESELLRFRLAMDASVDSIYLTDLAAMRFVDVNAAACRRLGYSREQLRAMGPHDVLAVDRERLRREYERVIAAGEQGDTIEHAYVKADGSRGWTDLHRRGLRSDGGWLIVTVGHDVTDRKLAQLALQENEEKYRLIFEGESDAIVLIDAESSRFLDANQAFVSLYGYSRSELLEMKAHEISAEPEATQAYLSTVLEVGRFEVPLRRHRKKDGTVFPVQISASPITLRGKRAICGIIRDISTRVRDEQRIANLTRLYATLSATNVTIVHATDRDALLRDLCRVAVETGKFGMAWVGLVDPACQEIRPLASYGADHGHLASIRFPMDGTLGGPAFTAMVAGKVAVSNDSLNGPPSAPSHAEAAQHGFRSAAVLPLRMDGKPIGIFNL